MSMMSEFMAQINMSQGLAKPNRFHVYIPTTPLGANSAVVFKKISAIDTLDTTIVDWFNDWYGGNLQATQVELEAFCEKSQLPGYQFQLETNRHYGPSFKIPHMPEYQDITMTFMCSMQMWERYFFDAWMYLVMDPVSNNFNYKTEYAVDIDIVQFFEKSDADDASVKNGAPLWDGTIESNYMSTLYDAFPVSIAEQALGYDMNNQIQKLEVTFTYKYALPFTGKGSTTGMQRRGEQELFVAGIKQPAPPK